MRVVHFSTNVDSGGAAVAMRRLHRALAAQGVESRVLGCLGKSSSEENIEVVPEWRPPGIDEIEASCVHANRTSLSNTHFSLDLRGARVVDHPAVRDADVLHLHWTAGFLSTRSLHELADLGKPVCWTLHDLRPITGGCHFPSGCENFRAMCDPCAQLERDPLAFARNAQAAQHRAVARLRPHFISPSRSLAEAARASSVAAGLPVSHIPNGVDLAEFAPRDRAAARRQLGLCEDARYILLGAHDFTELRKGVAQAGEILTQLADDPRVHNGEWRLVFAGGKPPSAPGGWTAATLGLLAPSDMATAYAATDVLLFTSLEDNLPNILLEAAASAQPIVALDVGGVPDIVRPGVNGGLFPVAPPSAIVAALREMLENPELSRRMGLEGRRLAEREFSLDQQAAAHIRLYENLLAIPRNTPILAEDRAEGAQGAPILALEWNLARTRAEAEALRAALATARDESENIRAEFLQHHAATEHLHALAHRQSEVAERLRHRIEFLESRIEEIGNTKWFRLGTTLRAIDPGITQVRQPPA
jgi:glycosyltransferase involved in cell wall biosynthesis